MHINIDVEKFYQSSGEKSFHWPTRCICHGYINEQMKWIFLTRLIKLMVEWKKISLCLWNLGNMPRRSEYLIMQLCVDDVIMPMECWCGANGSLSAKKVLLHLMPFTDIALCLGLFCPRSCFHRDRSPWFYILSCYCSISSFNYMYCIFVIFTVGPCHHFL